MSQRGTTAKPDRDPDSSVRTVRTFCRICQAACGLEVTVANGQVTTVRGDRNDPMSRGYACFKGLQAPEQHNGPERIRAALCRDSAGEFSPIGVESALDDVAAQISAIVAEHGPDSVALFMGTQSVFSTITQPLVAGFAESLSTKRLYGTMTIDQSAKWIADSRLGSWAAGPQEFDTADVWMMIGSNPLVSMVAGAGTNFIAFNDPVKRLKAARARGQRLIVIDPRRSETARFADIHLRPRPGEDAALVASLLQVILREGWHDLAFCDAHVDGMKELAQELRSFAPEAMENRTGVTAEDVIAAAAMFARDARRGMAGTGTGPSMGPYSNVAEHLVQCLNVICGRFPRAGEAVFSPPVIVPRQTPRAQVVPPIREWESGPRSDVHGLGAMRGQLMTATLVDDILQPGDNRVRALISVGGNPAAAFPDQARALEALARLDLLVAVEPRMTGTAERAHYILAPRLQFERADHTGFLDAAGLFQVPYAHYTAPIVEPTDGLVEEWEVIWGLAKRLGVTVPFGAGTLPMDEKPDKEVLLALFAQGGRVPLEELRAAKGGRLFPDSRLLVEEGEEIGRFQLAPGDVLEELRQVRVGADVVPGPPGGSRFRLMVRRHREVMNTLGTDFAATHERLPFNPAYMHPDDLEDLGLAPGQTVDVVGALGTLTTGVRPDPDLRRGTVSMSHCWPATAGQGAGCTNLFVDSRNGTQTINHMPVMTAIPVDVRPNRGAGR